MSSMPIDWDEDVINNYLTAESHQKTREQFFDTHIPIDKIRNELSEDFVTEEDVLDRILWSTPDHDNRIFILRGTTGSGKSHLCQWLEYKIGRTPEEGSEDHVALHVSRGDTALSDILRIITEPLDESPQVGSAENISSFAGTAVSSLRTRAESGKLGYEEDVKQITQEGSNAREALERTIAQNFEKYKKRSASDNDQEQPDLLDEKGYREVATAAFGKARGGDTLFPALKQEVHSILSDNLGVGDFRERLREYAEEYAQRGLRPVLICEDITTFNVLKEQLLDHIFELYTDANESGYDVVLGYTTGWEEDQAGRAIGTGDENTLTYMKERSEMYLSTTDQQGRTYFLDEDVTVKMAKKYLSVIREKSSTEADREIPEAAFDDLYPFNPSFIERAYQNLIQEGNERRTPRLLLVRVIRQCLQATSPPYEAVADNPFVGDFPTDVDLMYDTEIQQLTKWYGRPTIDQEIAVRKGILQTFDINTPDNSIAEGEDIIFATSGAVARDLSIYFQDGKAEPGETITVRATLNNHPEQGVEIRHQDNIVAESDGSGEAEIELPEEEGSVAYQAQKEDLSDTLTVDVGSDSLSLNVSPANPEPGDTVMITVLFNDQSQSEVSVLQDGEKVDETDETGEVTITAPDQKELTLQGRYEGLADTKTIDIDSEEKEWPVETDLSDEQIQQRYLEFQQWVSSGEEYESSKTLQDGVAEVLEKWHDSTRLANTNASQDGAWGIYYAKGTSVPVSLAGVAEKKGRSFELPFGPEYQTVYEPMFWAGISEDGELPPENNGELGVNYDELRAWVDDQVFEFRETMREDIEDSLPDEMNIEELIVLSQFLLLNGAWGVNEVSRDLVFEEYKSLEKHDSREDYGSPIREQFDKGNGFHEAYDELTHSSVVPQGLAEGFFKLKKGFVDHDRLDAAWKSVEENLDQYIKTAMQISPTTLGDGYRMDTTRSKATRKVREFLERVKAYATELNALTPSECAEHITDAVDTIKEWHDPSQSVPELQESFGQIWDAVEDIDAGEMGQKSDWREAKESLDDQSSLSLNQFNNEFERFRDIEEASDVELVSLLHEFEQSRSNRIEWEIYEALGEMIEAAENTKLPGEKDYRGQVAELDAVAKAQDLMNEIQQQAEGDE